MPEQELGSLTWGKATNGLLTRSERRRLAGAVLRDAARFARSRLLVAAGRGQRSGSADVSVLEPPDTRLAEAVEALARAQQSPQMLGHALRSVGFAHAIAGLDGVRVDAELLWCACLLHDVALEQPVPGQCFAVRGGLMAERAALDAGADHATAAALGDAVSRHATPDLDAGVHPLPYLVAGGALVDVLGKRLDEMDRAFTDLLLRAQPRDGFAPLLAQAWRAEARAVPHGRAAVAERTACFSVAARYAPLPR